MCLFPKSKFGFTAPGTRHRHLRPSAPPLNVTHEFGQVQVRGIGVGAPAVDESEDFVACESDRNEIHGAWFCLSANRVL